VPCALLLAACAAAALGAPAALVQDAPDRPRVEAVRVAAPPTIDGRLDDPAWLDAPVATRFHQKIPDEGAPAREETEVRFLYDEEALYVGARMYSDDPAGIQAPVSRRDQVGSAEKILVALDTFHDRRTAWAFGITASGVRQDRYHARDQEGGADDSWDPVWEGRARVDSLGWTAEMRIPFSQLRFRDSPAQVWGVNLNRWIPKRNEDSYWVVVPRSESGYASRFGDLLGIEGIPPSRRLEVTPYVAARASMLADADPADPFAEDVDGSLRVGGDLKMGLGPNLTLDATVNPDFGQVEADPAEVNLSAFETFFDERRPFFLEGGELFENRGPGYFYSRRIGASPHGSPPSDFADVPESTTILGAAKVTGRMGSGLSLGALAAATAEEQARTFEEESGTFDTVEVEPTTVYGVTRAQQQFGEDQSTAGVILTAVGRDLEAGDPLAALLSRRAYGGAADWNLRFRDGEYELSGSVGFSRVEGEPEAMERLQRSSARYYQRPDADYVEVEPGRTSLSGWTGLVEIARESGDHWLWLGSLGALSPGFGINDAGRLSQSDAVVGEAGLEYRETRPGAYWQDWSLGLETESEWNFGGTRTYSSAVTFGELTLPNFWRADVELGVEPRATSDVLTRGGPLMGTPRAWWTYAALGSSFSAANSWRGEVLRVEDEFGGHRTRLATAFTLRPSPRWALSLDPAYEESTAPRQFVAALEGGRAATFGIRYVFGFIDRTTLSTRMRVNYTFRPGLTLEVYAEPFAASGRYYDFGEVRSPGSRDLLIYDRDAGSIVEGPDGTYTVTDETGTFAFTRSDFNVRSFRSNAVLRWEWSPGSTLFVVWQQDRASDSESGSAVRVGDLWETLDEPGDNVLAVKVSYWLPVGR